MKFFENKFEDYITNVEKFNLHKEKELFFKQKWEEGLDNLNHMIFYGSSGIGKYSQVLYFIKKWSKTNLKYERKINYKYNNKYDFTFKTSDIHFEIDIDLLGCYAKLLFNELYYHILDVCNTTQRKKTIIVCKNFHKIHTELLDIFYSYMQNLQHKNLKLVFILLSESVSFLPQNILNRCEIVEFSKPKLSLYNKIYKKSKHKNMVKFGDYKQLTNIKDIKAGILKTEVNIEKTIIRKLYELIIDYKKIDFLEFRDFIYDLFIYNVYVESVIYSLINKLLIEKYLSNDGAERIIYKTVDFLKYYNNNYRPIYHVELILFEIIKEIHCL
tara:strand:- start:101 stop:1084 length:984 start_codon:yes stop_codon:yes gene_type:complete